MTNGSGLCMEMTSASVRPSYHVASASLLFDVKDFGLDFGFCVNEAQGWCTTFFAFRRKSIETTQLDDIQKYCHTTLPKESNICHHFIPHPTQAYPLKCSKKSE